MAGATSLQFSASNYSVNENDGTATITVTRTGGTDSAVSVDYATSDGSATAGSDYTPVSGNLSWAIGDQTGRNITVKILDDNVAEGNETVNLTLSNATGGASLGSPGNATLTIVDNDNHGTLQFSASNYSVNENDGTATITVTRTGGSDGAVALDYATSDGTATAGIDYTATSGTLRWAAGDSTAKTFTVPILDDNLVEGNETVGLTLGNATGGASLGNPGNATLTIVDNDHPGTLQFSASNYSVNENDGSATITVTRSDGSSGAVSVNYATSDGTATAGSDYTATSGTLNWTDGDTAAKTFTIPILDDNVEEGNETVALSLTGDFLGTPSSATLTIVDNDHPGTLQLSASNYSVNENGGTATITVTRAGGSSGAVSVNYATSDGSATAGSDYTATSGTLNWAAGDTAAKTFPIPILDDNVVEGNETIALSLTGDFLGTPSSATLTIVDNDSHGTLRFSTSSYSVDENGGSATITVTRSGGSIGAVSVDYATSDGTATAGSDYTTTSGTLNWAAGDDAAKTFTIPILYDNVVEGDETVDLNLSNATGGANLGTPSNAALTIVNVEAPGTLQFSTSSYNVNENGGSATIIVMRSGGSSGAVAVDYATSNDTATAGSDYSATSGTLNWAAGDSAAKTFTIPILDDTLVEGDETVTLNLSNATGGAILGSPNSATLTIIDNDSADGTTIPGGAAPTGPTIEPVAGEGQNGGPGTLLSPFTVLVIGTNGQPMANAIINWSVSPTGAGTLQSGAATTTAANGQTSNTLQVNQNGVIRVTAAVPGGGFTILLVNSIAQTPGLTPVQEATGGALDAACPALEALGTPTTAQQDLLNTCNALATASNGEIATALQQMAPDEVATQGTSMVEFSNVQLQNVGVRFNELRAGATGFSVSGLSLRLFGQTLPNVVFSALGGKGGGGASADDQGGLLSNRWGAFINGSVSVGDKKATFNEPGFDFDTAGLTAGVDYRYNEQLVWGGALGYVTRNSDMSGGGSQDVDGYFASLYGTYYRTQQTYVDTILSIGRNNFDSRRQIAFGSVNQTAIGKTDGTEYGLSVSSGYDWHRDALTFGPYGRIEYIHADIGSYLEQSSGSGSGIGLMLAIDKQNIESLTTNIGGQVSYAYSTKRGIVSPQLRVDWAHEFQDDSRFITARFLNDPSRTTFGLPTDSPDRDYFNVGAGVTATFAAGKSAFVYYEGMFSRADASQHAVTLGGRMEF